MAIDPMADAVSGAVASSSEYNNIIDNIIDLDTRVQVNEALTTNTTTNGGQGNARLADRLGTGVTTSASTTNGTATAQLTDLRSRATAVEARATALEADFGTTAKFQHTVAQTIAASSLPSPTVWEAILYQTVLTANAAITKAAGHNQFTFNKAGLWLVLASVTGTSASTAAGIKHLMLSQSPSSASGTIYATNSVSPLTGQPWHLQVSALIPAAVSDTVSVNFYTLGGSQTTVANTPTLAFAYLGG